MKPSIKILQESELEQVVDYFLELTSIDDKRMCIDRNNLPNREEWINMLVMDSRKPLQNRQYFYIGWLQDGKLIGHCGINKIKFGEEAYIHLHLWQQDIRQKGLGLQYFLLAIQFYFNHFSFKKIICEPNTENPAPNKTLLKAGFKFMGSYRTKPSALNIEHNVNRYELTKEAYEESNLYHT